MTTVKIKFRTATSAHSGEGTLLYQVIHKRTTRQICTGYKLFADEWDAVHSEIIIKPKGNSIRHTYLVSLKQALQQDIKRLHQIILQLDGTGNDYKAEEVVKIFLQPTNNHYFLAFTHSLIRHLKTAGKHCTAERYTTTLNSFTRFRKGEDIPLEDIDSDLMTGYASYLHQEGACPNTCSFYMRNLRAIYNRAVEKELVKQRHPFKHVYTGIDKTVKRAVSLHVIREIRNMNLVRHSSMDYSRDIFMFSFYTRGMSLIDMAFLKKKNLQNGILTYRRHKTNQQLSIKWEKPMQELINKYDTTDTPYLLPIIKNNGLDERKQYKKEALRINRNLKKIGIQLGLTIPLTSYVARHGWASIAKSKNIPLATISEAMGHNSERTTRIYLASLDTSSVDKANKLILNSLKD